MVTTLDTSGKAPLEYASTPIGAGEVERVLDHLPAQMTWLEAWLLVSLSQANTAFDPRPLNRPVS